MQSPNYDLRTTRSVRTRFAPSPTGFLHVGGVRTALFAWLLARQAKGQFILRIEDTDRSRHVEQSERHIMDCLKWLGLEWDEGPIRQSERLAVYQEWAKKLADNGQSYADVRSPGDLEGIRKQAAAQKKPVLFRDYRPDKPPVWQKGMPLRFKSEPKAYKWHDEVLGELSTGPEVVDDFIIIKSDGFPTYNFAHIIDDHLMQISHVIRSQEFLPSVPKYLNLYEALAIERPKLATLPYVMAPDGHQKLSKRHGAKDILDYKREGYLPEALINFLASLGWNDGTNQEIFTLSELTDKFNLNHVHRGGARFDEERLKWMNGHYIRALGPESLAGRAEAFWPAEAKDAAEDYKKAVLGLVQERLKFLAELPGLTTFFFTEPKEDDIRRLYLSPPDKLLQKAPPTDFCPMLKQTRAKLEPSDFSHDDITNRLNELLDELNTKPGRLFPLIRIAVSGAQSTPELAGTLSVLGKERSLSRIETAVNITAQLP